MDQKVEPPPRSVEHWMHADTLSQLGVRVVMTELRRVPALGVSGHLLEVVHQRHHQSRVLHERPVIFDVFDQDVDIGRAVLDMLSDARREALGVALIDEELLERNTEVMGRGRDATCDVDGRHRKSPNSGRGELLD